MNKSKGLVKTCAVAGCGKTFRGSADRLCGGHRYHKYRYGTKFDLLPLPEKISDEMRFWNQVELTADPNRCWIWSPRPTNKGVPAYGVFSVRCKNVSAHKFAWITTHRRTPTGVIRHTCDNKWCVNPNHLLEGTNADNSRDMVERNRQACGEKNGNAVLDADRVRVIRRDLKDGRPYREIALNIGVSDSTVRLIALGRIWRHVE
jgi:hypothetical protein